MNHIYRLIWNEITRASVAVAEIARGRGKRSGATVGYVPRQGKTILPGTAALAGILATSLALIGAPSWALDAGALPTGGKVVAGSASISQAANVLTVQQSSQRAALDWQRFHIGSAATVNFVQPGSSAVALNRILGKEASQIYGKLNANGQVFFSNPHGMLFARGAQVNVGGILATTLAIGNEDFMASNYRFNNPGAGSIRNEGLINALGSAALVGNDVHNAGQLIATTVTLAAGNTVAIDLTGDGLIRARVDDAALKARIENSGSINGAAIAMTAGQARDTLDRVVNNSGVVRATELANINGEIVLEGDSVLNAGTLNARQADGSGGAVVITARNGVSLTSNSQVLAAGTSTRQGGSIIIGGGFVGLGGTVSAEGSQGGQIQVSATGTLSLADPVIARGTAGAGGTIGYSAGKIMETNTGNTDASGTTDGGRITVQAGGTLMTSGHYDAHGGTGKGGRIDFGGYDVRLLSAQIDASGAAGGLVRIGGAFQGGKPQNDPSSAQSQAYVQRWGTLQTITNADQTFINDSSRIDVSGKVGAGGTAVVWSDRQTTFLGGIAAGGGGGFSPQTGGQVEISAGETLRHARLEGIEGAASLLLDPKNIIIGDQATVSNWSYSAILGKGYSSSGRNLDASNLESGDNFGYAVALNATGNRLAVGAYLDDGAGNAATDSGAVHLFSFSDSNFSGASLQGTLGKGYSGGKNLDVSSLGNGDGFGHAVALNATGDRLAVGAPFDAGAGNTVTDSGAVHLFSFSDSNFSGASLQATLGKGYSGGKNLDVSSLDNNDQFGYSVALNATGDRLAVGAYADAGASNALAAPGAVHLFSFSDSSFSGASLQSTLGKGYSGGKNLDVSSLEANEYFGWSVALNAAGDRLAVGALQDDGASNVATNSGAVHLFSFSDGNFSGASLQGTLGKGYAGGKNLDVSSVESDDYFGAAVALNATGDRLAVGAYLDDGAGNAATNSGAVHLFSFSDSNFSGTSLQATLGKGYNSDKNLDVSSLENHDYFGNAVALNATGDRLAVGAYRDGGAGNAALLSGAVRLFSFTDTSFTGGALQGTLGKGYTPGKNLDVSSLESGDYFGTAVALNATGDRLAVGALCDAGAGNAAACLGAVHLFSFSDSNFSGASLQATLGNGYTSGKNLDVSNLESGDRFGHAVALNATGDRLAVGATYDDGAGNSVTNSGAAYLFSFSDSNFSGASLQATLGKGYTGGKNLDVSSLESGDRFGSAVALNAAGDRLAVGAWGDDGAGNAVATSGAVHLFSFGDSNFSGASLQATLGNGYTSGKNLDVSNLESGDRFGHAVALNATGDRLAVGATYDDGAGNSVTNSGAAYLFSFSDSNFSGASLQATLGKGYSGGKNLDVSSLETNDYFGSAVALNATGDRLAVAAWADDGAGNAALDLGAVHLFSFSDSNFSGASLQATLGKGYSGGKNLDVSSLESGDYFGTAVALNATGDRLAVGAYGDAGAGNAAAGSGAVRLFSFSDSNFSGASLQATLGKGYSGGKNLDVSSLDNNDHFGTAVALNATGDRLAVGADYDDGAGNTVSASGAVHLFSFSDSNFSGASLQATLGKGYSGGKNLDVSSLESDDRFGVAVALNATGDRLAVGAMYDDGAGNAVADSGAVRLFSFSDGNFSGASLQATVGKGYSGGKNLDVDSLDIGDNFGFAVALNAAGDRLGVGAPFDAGVGNAASASGAVHLFSFSDSNFSGVSLQATLGKGYTGGKNFDVSSLENNDYFGRAIALNATGDRLAVGAPTDAGAGNAATDSGAVRLFSFSDSNFSGASLLATLGKGYSGGKNLDVSSLDNYDQFGYAVAINATGDRLAVGAYADAGAGNAVSQSGAVRLFSFSDSNFSGASLQATLGKGYSGGKNLDVSSLENSDSFGHAVALNATGDRMAVGAMLDDGAGNAATNSGAVRLFSFSDSNFSGASLQATLGKGYTGGKNLDVSSLENGDIFGMAVALDATGDRLAVGAYGDAGAGNAVSGSGAVHLFSATPETGPYSPTAQTYATLAGQTSTVSAAQLNAVLSSGTSVTLQASNDITVASVITGNNPSGNGGTLALQAGRSILVNANITTDNGNLAMTANDTLANGVVTADRDAGAAQIALANGVALNAGTGSVTLQVLDGAGRTGTQATAGDISLNVGSVITAGTGASLFATPGNLNVNGTVSASAIAVSANAFTFSGGIWNQVAATLPGFAANDFKITGGTFIRALGGDGTAGTPYQLADIYGVQGMGSTGMLGKSYVLANNIDASGTSSWNSGAGFDPIGNLSTKFSGIFNGQQHTISNLAINRPATNYVGLFGYTNGSTISNIGLAGGSVVGVSSVGALVGVHQGTISNSYAAVSVTGTGNTHGGLVGYNDTGSTISDSYAAGVVNGTAYVGGLAGYNVASIIRSYATGTVASNQFDAGGLVGYNTGSIAKSFATGVINGTSRAGGLVGNHYGAIDDSYATGNVTGAGNTLGGLVGYSGGSIATSFACGSVSAVVKSGGLVGDNTPGSLSSSYWNSDVTTTGIGTGSTSGASGLSTAQMKQLSTFTGWNIANTGASGATWRIYEGQTTPLLRSFLKPLTVTANAASKTYDAGAYSGGIGVTYSVASPTLFGTLTYGGTAQGAINAGGYTIAPSGYYSNQQGYDISYANGILTIAARPLTVTADAKSKIAGESDPALTYAVGATAAGTGLVGGDSLSGALARIAGETVASSPYAITQGSLSASSNYSLSFTGNNLVITAAVAVDPCIASPMGAGCPTVIQAAADAAAKAAADAAAAKAVADAQAAADAKALADAKAVADAKALADAKAAADAKALADAQAAANARALADAQAAADTKALADAAAAAAAEAAAKIIAEAAAAAKAAATSATVSNPNMTAAVVTSSPGEGGASGTSGGTSSPAPVASATSSTSATDSEDKSETKPAAKPVVATVIVANTTVQKPADQVVQLDRPKGQTLVCR